MRLFLSYGHDDNAPLVELIRQELEAAGFATWMDASHIKGGEAWRRSILEGLKQTDRTLAFLSRHALRFPGVCRDEIAISLAERGGDSVLTVLVEPEEELQIPASISHIQWIAMTEWRTELGSSNGRAWLRSRCDEIIERLRDPRTLAYSAEIDTLRRVLNPLPQHHKLPALLRDFVGREALIASLDEFLSRPQAPGMPRLAWLTGEPGIGKSAVAAWLMHHRPERVVAGHFCDARFADTVNPAAVLLSVVFQVACRLPQFRASILYRLNEITGLNVAHAAAFDQLEEVRSQVAALSASAVMERLLVEPLRSAIDAGHSVCALIIDGLDEADQRGERGRRSNEMAELLQAAERNLPSWFRFVVTCRPESHLLRRFEGYPHYQLLKDAQNSADAATHIDAQLRALSLNEQDRCEARLLLVERSEGNFEYLRLALARAAERGWTMEDARRTPKGLSNWYASAFNERFLNHYEFYDRAVRPYLSVLLAAHAPVPHALICKALRIKERDFYHVRSFVRAYIREIQGASDGPASDSLFHRSLADWLGDATAAEDYGADAGEGHFLLATALAQALAVSVTSANGYPLDLIGDHLAEVPLERLDDVLGPNDVFETTCLLCAYVGTLTGAGSPSRALTLAHVLLRWVEAKPAAHMAILKVLDSLSAVLRHLGRYQEAQAMAERCFAKAREVIPNAERHPFTLSVMHELASALLGQGKREEAELLLVPVVAGLKEALREDAPALLSAMHTYATSLCYTYEFNSTLRSEQLAERQARGYDLFLELFEACQQPNICDQPHGLAIAHHYAEFLAGLGQYERAQSIHERAFDVARTKYGEFSDLALGHKGGLARALYQLHKLDAAAELRMQVLEARTRTLGDEHSSTRSAMEDLVESLAALDRYAEALPIQQRYVEATTACVGAQSREAQAARARLDELREDPHRVYKTELAEYEHKRTALGEKHRETLRSLSKLRDAINERGTSGRPLARFLERKILEGRLESLGEADPDSLESLFIEAGRLIGSGKARREEGIALQRRVIELSCRVNGGNHSDTLNYEFRAALRTRATGDYQLVANLLQGTFDKHLSVYGPDDARTRAVAERLESARNRSQRPVELDGRMDS